MTMLERKLNEDAGIWVEKHQVPGGFFLYKLFFYDNTPFWETYNILEMTCFLAGWIAHKRYIQGV